jgi:hypothetical protein
MPIYMCRWENGDISFVSAMSKDGSIWALDEVGTATAGMLYAVNQFMVHLTLDDHGNSNSNPWARTQSTLSAKWHIPFLIRSKLK